MGVLNNLFGSKSEKPEAVKVNWIALTSENQLENLTKTSVLFKHSTRCSISSSVLRRLEKQVADLESTVDFYYLDLLNFRNISAAIAEKFQVMHQSPQMVVVKNNKMVANASHYDILEIDLKSFIEPA
jgi:bacillithiol system protein YtxJ